MEGLSEIMIYGKREIIAGGRLVKIRCIYLTTARRVFRELLGLHTFAWPCLQGLSIRAGRHWSPNCSEHQAASIRGIHATAP